MNIIDTIIPEYKREMTSTRKTLERVPDEHLGWKPHDKSMTLGRLASHVAEIQGWLENAINEDVLELPPGQTPQVFHSREEMLKHFDEKVAAAQRIMPGVPNEKLMESWKLTSGGRTIIEMPRIAVVRGFIISHTIHHRAQLGVFLRLLDVPVPAVYGPSADEQGF